MCLPTPFGMKYFKSEHITINTSVNVTVSEERMNTVRDKIEVSMTFEKHILNGKL